MKRVMLATSAGADSRILHVAALRRADEAGASLSVVHVLDGLEYEAQPEELKDAIRSETEWLISTMLHLASDRSGVDRVETTIHVREGGVTASLVEFATTTRPDLVMVGVPRSADYSTFTESEFAELVTELERTGTSVEKVTT